MVILPPHFDFGSGPQNRDEELMGHKPFWFYPLFDQKWKAVLLFHDRVSESLLEISAPHIADFATDVASAIDI